MEVPDKLYWHLYGVGNRKNYKIDTWDDIMRKDPETWKCIGIGLFVWMFACISILVGRAEFAWALMINGIHGKRV